MTIQHLRSSTANKRPTPAAMSDGQLAVNTNTASPGLFFKDSAGALIKVGPVHVGTTAPNASPAGGGETGNTVGEQWLDTAGGTYVFKVWDGSAWRSESGTFVDVNGDVMTGALGIIAGSAGSPGLYFSGDTNTGLYSPGADQVAISTGGSGRLFVDASGNVGLGITPVANTLLGGARGSSLPGLIELAGNGNTVGSSGFAIGQDGSGVATLFQRANAAMYFATNGSERLRITSAGLVGVGTSSPSYVAHITGAKNTTQAFIGITGLSSANDYAQLGFGTGSTNYGAMRLGFDNPAGVTNTYLSFFNDNGSGLQERLRIDSSGRVGIGTTTPDQPMTLNAANGYPVMSFQNNGTTVGDIGFNVGLGMVLSGRSTNPILFYTNSSERARIDSSGRLLVGTSSARSNFFNTVAGTQFQVEGTTYQSSSLSLVATGNNSYDAGTLVLAKGRGNAVGSNTIVQNGTPPDILGYVSFQGNDGSEFVEGASIKAEVDGGVGANDLPSRLVFSTTADGASSPTERMRITSEGKLLIGKTDSSNTTVGVNLSGTGGENYFVYGVTGGLGQTMALNRTASDGSQIVFQRAGTTVGEISVNSSSTTYATSSDYRLKENVTPVTDGITRLQQLKPSRFNFIANPAQTVDGFIAHEVQAVVPEAITGTKDAVDADGNPKYQGIDQSKLVPLLTAALQEATGEIESLKTRVAALESA